MPSAFLPWHKVDEGGGRFKLRVDGVKEALAAVDA